MCSQKTSFLNFKCFFIIRKCFRVLGHVALSYHVKALSYHVKALSYHEKALEIDQLNQQHWLFHIISNQRYSFDYLLCSNECSFFLNKKEFLSSFWPKWCLSDVQSSLKSIRILMSSIFRHFGRSKTWSYKLKGRCMV